MKRLSRTRDRHLVCRALIQSVSVRTQDCTACWSPYRSCTRIMMSEFTEFICGSETCLESDCTANICRLAVPSFMTLMKKHALCKMEHYHICASCWCVVLRQFHCWVDWARRNTRMVLCRLAVPSFVTLTKNHALCKMEHNNICASCW